MKSKICIGLFISLLCGFYSAAQSPGTGTLAPYKPMSKLGQRMSNITNLNDLKQAYDTIRYNYDRRSFIRELPGYFTAKGISSIPTWVNTTVVSCLDSNNANLLNESIIAAGAFNIPCGAKLAAIYNVAPAKYGHHSEQIRTSIIHSLRQIHDPNNSQFFLDLLTKASGFFLSEQFEELLLGIDENRSTVYSPKLAECSSQLSSFQANLAVNKNPESDFEWVSRMLGKITTIQNKIALDQASVNGGGK
jgi:hypothetical protein